jgi:hypothetical protein
VGRGLDLYLVGGDKDHTKSGYTLGAAILNRKPDQYDEINKPLSNNALKKPNGDALS